MGDLIRRRLGAVIAVVVLLVVLFGARLATFFTDLWWYDSLGYRDVFTSILTAQFVVGLLFGGGLAILVAVNLLIARRIRPLFIPSTPQQAQVERYRQMADPYLPWIIAGIALLFALTAGAAASTEWDTYLLWRNGGEFPHVDPLFERNIGWYVFGLPWWKFVQSWLFTSLVLVTLLTAGAHYVLGGIRLESPGEKVMPGVKVHLSLLLAAVLAARGWGYWLDRYLLNYSPRGTVTGASFTDVNAELPALNLLLVITAVAIVLLVYNVRRRGFLLPGAAIGLLIVASIILQGAYPALIQRFRVDPQELPREAEFIERNLEATREAYGIRDTELRRFEVDNRFTEELVREEDATLRNIRLWDPQVLQTTYAELQALRPYYAFGDVDIDRYEIDGELRQVMLAARELNQAELPSQAQTWQNLTLTFTHGMGTVASQVNTATREGQPVFLSRDIPPTGVDELTAELPFAGIYFGEEPNPTYSVVKADTPELDFETGSDIEQVTTTYAGEGGVGVGGLGRRIAFAIRYGDPNLVLSNLLTDESEILINRDIQDRVRLVAPYLTLDHDPYPVVLDNRVLWVQDAYTTSPMYPYSERRDFGGQAINYIRNSVKAVVDAYDGTVTLFVVNPEDPLVQAWRSAFPAPYADLDEAPEGLIEHFRYPEDFFTLQADIYRTYHIPTAAAFYSKADEWEIPLDAATIANQPEGSTSRPPLRPYYLLMRLPGETDTEFVLIQPYLALNKPNMNAWLAGRSDPEHYGQLFAVQFPSDQTILGPGQAQARIEQEDEIARYITLRDQRGSRVIRGNLLVIPIGGAILYVEPLFLENEQARIPELAQVVLVLGEDTVMAPTLRGAIEELLGAEVEDTLVDEPITDVETEPDQAEQAPGDLLLRALELFVEAQQALQAGDLGRYQELLDQAQELVRQAAELEGVDTTILDPAETPPDAEGGSAPPNPDDTEDGDTGEEP